MRPHQFGRRRRSTIRTPRRDSMVETVEHPVIGSLKMLGIPFKFSDTPGSVRRAPPALGQHTDEILSGELGMDAQSIAKLRADKVI